MEQTISRTGRRMGWSDFESNLLWETAEEAQKQGLPLKSVFERIAQQTGRRPNSIRNYYYAQARQQEGGGERAQRFVPFTQEEIDWLMEQVLRARAQGQSVRSCLQTLSGGDHSRMLRYQNKYRSVIKNRPDYVRALVERLQGEGVACDPPQVNHRPRPDLESACGRMVEAGRASGDVELARALETLSRRLTEESAAEADLDAVALAEAVRRLIQPVKDFIARQGEDRAAETERFCQEVAGLIGEVEARLPCEADVLPAGRKPFFSVKPNPRALTKPRVCAILLNKPQGRMDMQLYADPVNPNKGGGGDEPGASERFHGHANVAHGFRIAGSRVAACSGGGCPVAPWVGTGAFGNSQFWKLL